MYPTRVFNLLMVALSVTAVTGVAWIDKRQDGSSLTIGTGADDSTTSPSSETVASVSSTDTPSSSSTEQPDSTTSPSSSQSTPTSPPADSTTSPASIPASPTSSGTAGPTTPPPSSSIPTPTSPTSTSTSTSSTSTEGDGGDSTTSGPATTAPPTTSTLVIFTTSTDAGGQTVVYSSSSLIVSTPTPVPSSPDSQSGMPQDTKNIIIGVCVGVGGAIVLGVAGLLFWRLRSKRRNQDENEELVSYGEGFGGPGTAEKTEPTPGGTAAGRSPFQSTLESYHAPTQTNAASNF
ncbi:hypothetical protein GGR54DRAFT_639899 [Hypoxylon sp. NC1633]|nr:hypothetical protein GGR54DRAFT_639899 [Hypoxylon sp. NC1633]